VKFYKQTYALGAGIWQRIDVGGTQLVILQGDNLDVEFLSHKSAHADVGTVPQGIRFHVGDGFDGVRIKSATTVSATVIIADDQVDLQAVAQSVTVASIADRAAGSVSPRHDGSQAESIAAGGSAAIPQNVNDRSRTIQADSDNTGPLYVTSVDDGAHYLARLDPGQSVTFNSSDELVVVNDGSAAQGYRAFAETG